MPFPQDELWRLSTSPVPTQTMDGFDGATATAPMDIMPPEWSNTGAQETPWLLLLNTPPLAVPTYMVSGWPGGWATAKSAIRPPVEAGPMARQFNPWTAEEGTCAAAVAAARRTQARSLIRDLPVLHATVSEYRNGPGAVEADNLSCVDSFPLTGYFCPNVSDRRSFLSGAR